MRRALSVLLAFSLTACATVDHGPMQRIQVVSEPAGAKVHLVECGPGSTKEARSTPAVVWVSRRAKRCTLRLTADGYLTETFHLERIVSEKTGENIDAAGTLCDDETNCNSLSDLFIVGALAGVIIGTGMGVDAATGARWQQTPSRVALILQRVEPR